MNILVRKSGWGAKELQKSYSQQFDTFLCTSFVVSETLICMSWYGSEPFWAVLNLFWTIETSWKYDYFYSSLPLLNVFSFTSKFFQSDLKGLAILLRQIWWEYMIYYTVFRAIHCALATDSLCPSTRAQWSVSGFFRKIYFTEIIFVIAKRNVPCYYTITIPT